MGHHASKSFDMSAYIPDTSFDTSPAIFRSSGRYNPTKEDIACQTSQLLPSARTIHAHRLMKLHFPKGIPWHDYPVVSDGQYRPDLDGGEQWLDTFVQTIPAVQAVVGAMGKIVYDEFGYKKDTRYGRYLTGAMAEQLFPGTAIWSRFDGETEPTARTPFQLMERDRAHLRLRYSYAVNFRAIGFKALRHVVEPDSPALVAPPEASGIARRKVETGSERRMHFLRVGISRFERLEYLQFLFALLHLDRHQLFMSFSNNFVAPQTPAHVENHHWLGTGKYPPVGIALDFDSFLIEAVGLGLADVDFRNHAVTLSGTGRQFLDMMHPDNEDVDAICRWAWPLSIERIDAADAWILRFFRKMKTRVNLLD